MKINKKRPGMAHLKTFPPKPIWNNLQKGSGCGLVGRAVASDTRRIQSSSNPYMEHLFYVNYIKRQK